MPGHHNDELFYWSESMPFEDSLPAEIVEVVFWTLGYRDAIEAKAAYDAYARRNPRSDRR